MKKINILAALAMLCCTLAPVRAQQTEPENEKDRLTFMLFGASFAIPQNGWFEIGCEYMGAEAINKAVSGEAIYNDARRMAAGTDYTVDELDRTDVLVLMHVHNQNVANEEWLKDSWEDYDNITTTTNYAVGYDYVIKRYMADCAALEFNPESKYYGITGGKPAKIMLCTHWHDGRTTYNPAIRKLAEKWGFPLIEFDTNIGFSKDDEGLADKGEPSRACAHDTETIDNIKYGWHPKRGANSAIQRRMAAIFTQTVAEHYGYDFPFEIDVKPVCPLYMEGEDAHFAVTFKSGMFPYSISGDYEATGLDGTRHIFTRRAITSQTSVNIAGDCASRTADAGTLAAGSASATAGLATYRALPDFDSYVSKLNVSGNFDNADVIQLKYAHDASRKAYIAFQASEEMPRDADRIILRLYYKDYILGYFNSESSRPMEGIELIGVEGNTNKYNGLNINWNTAANHVFEAIDSEAEITTDMAGTWVGIDVTDWAKKTLAALETQHGNKNTGHLTFRLFIKDNNWNALMNFYSSEGAAAADSNTAAGPQLLFGYIKDISTGLDGVGNRGIRIEGQNLYNPENENVTIYGVDGVSRYQGRSERIRLSELPHGIYVIRTPEGCVKYVR